MKEETKSLYELLNENPFMTTSCSNGEVFIVYKIDPVYSYDTVDERWIDLNLNYELLSYRNNKLFQCRQFKHSNHLQEAMEERKPLADWDIVDVTTYTMCAIVRHRKTTE